MFPAGPTGPSPTRGPRVTRAFAALGPALLALCAAVALAGCAGTAGGTTSGTGRGDTGYVPGAGTSTVFPVAERVAAPRIDGTTLDGAALALPEPGTTYVLNYWASWCAPCRDEAPALVQLSTDYAARGVRFVGVNLKDGRDNAKAFARTYRLRFPTLYDPAGEIAVAFRESVPPAAVPSTIVIDGQGRIAARVIGAITHSRLKALLDEVLAGQT